MQKIIDGIYSCGVTHSDRPLFDELIPLPEGTSYNAYIVQGSEKTALIDCSYPEKETEFLENIKSLNAIDYIVANHGEQDHTGVLAHVMKMFPTARLLTNAKCKQTITDAMPLDETRIDIVDDNTEISLGGKTLKFVLAPWVHWPDTMFTWIPEDKILFTCDFLGAHTSRGETFARENVETYIAAKRYYAEIMMPFRSFCAKYLKKIRELAPAMICPSHGGVYKNPEFILKAYDEWTCETPDRKVIIPYVSMYGNSFEMAKYLAEKLEAEGVEVVLTSLVKEGIGEYAEHIVDAGAIVYAGSVVLTDPHPAIAGAAYLTNLLKPKAKFYATIASYAWGGKFPERIADHFRLYKPENLGSVMAKGKANPETFKGLDALAKTIAEKLPQESEI